jgi:hypothetical protein
LEQQKNSRVRVEVKALVLILIHTPFGLEFFDKVAKWRIAKFYARFNTYLMPAPKQEKAYGVSARPPIC